MKEYIERFTIKELEQNVFVFKKGKKEEALDKLNIKVTIDKKDKNISNLIYTKHIEKNFKKKYHVLILFKKINSLERGEKNECTRNYSNVSSISSVSFGYTRY